jgi:fibronectin type 3 domain-containing protein
VRALDAGGNESEASNRVSLETELDDDQTPAPPEFLHAELTGNTAIQLTWRAPTTDEDGSDLTGLSHYRIYRSEGTGSAGFAWIATVDSTNLRYVDSGLETSTTYIYQVRALDAGGNESEASNRVSLETELDDDQTPALSMPAATRARSPEFLHAELTGNTAIQLTWRAPATDEDGSDLTGLSHYRIYRSEGTGSAGFAWIATVDSTNLRYVDSGLETSTTYIYQVRALDAGGNESEASNRVSLETGSVRSVPQPTMVAAALRDLEDQGLAIVVTWRAPAGITSFGVYRQLASSSSSNKFETLAFRLSDTKYIDTDIESGKTYIYRIVSLQGSSFSDPSDPVVVAVP